MTEYYADPLVTLLHGDCIEVMATLPADSVDAVVTDPPYGLEFMGKTWDELSAKKWGNRTSNPTTFNSMKLADGADRIASPQYSFSRGIQCEGCGKWQGGKSSNLTCRCETPKWRNRHRGAEMQDWHHAWAVEALRVTKPGGYLLAFGGTRTHHRLVCALEDAGWIIRDELDWIYASGFPKGKANLKPAHEPIVLARKPGPLRPLAIDECRIDHNGEPVIIRATEQPADLGILSQGARPVGEIASANPSGRWPSNVLLSDPELFDEPNPYVVGSGAVTTVPGNYIRSTDVDNWGVAEMHLPGDAAGDLQPGYGDSGGYSRFFIVPKADRAERERGLADRPKGSGGILEGNADHNNARKIGARPDLPVGPRANVHPTVKPIDLMRHLVRLVTPSGGVVLDPFLGSGTTALAASELGLKCIGIEREAEYLDIAKSRLIATPIGLGLDDGFNMEVGA